MFSTDEDARREEDGADAGIELSSLNWRDSGKESVLVVGMGWDFLDHQTCKGLAKDRYGGYSYRKNWSSAPGFMLLGNENVINFTTKSIA